MTGIEEAVALASEPIGIFDADSQLVTVNPSFRKAFSVVSPYLSTGTPWNVFLTECVRVGLLSEAAAVSLRIIEERYLGRTDLLSELQIGLAGEEWRPELVEVSGDGFALVLRRLAEGGREDKVASELEELMSKVLLACPVCLIMSRIGDGRVLYRSPAATDLLGKGFNSLEHFANREDRADFITQLLPTARVDDMHITARRGDGSEFPALLSARLIDYRGEDVIVASLEDLTERLAAEAEIERQKKKIFQFEKMSALGELLAGIAHELNNPLSVVVGNAHLLLEEDLDTSLIPRVEKLTASAERCVRIVRTFLSMVRDRPLSVARVGTARLVQGAVEAFRAEMDEPEINVDIDLQPDLPDLLVDEVQVVQVLMNLVMNAVQAITASGTGSRVDVTACSIDGHVRIRVVDDGPGIPREIAAQVFDPLFTTKEAGEGTGLGLALSHRIVLAHGGSIDLEAERDRGAAFVVDLPVAPDPA
ncbi:PAS domain S-box protein [Silicimonas algicola]|uniref:histidine kinase n=1 Tax=Silicimonas algicola TaxID=1826607 RepID=A0A316FY45_9RHOB|nr:ATP-binding protein [Silicimonas algicola]AZQ68406.1 PAS domain S-box protein [Silicimonas algicola]PWK53508.1 PAS domain S-box-containing protein [Silicimonas algicola]